MNCENCSQRVPCGVGYSGCDNECGICGQNCGHNYRICECGIKACSDCMTTCDACDKRFCDSCWSYWTKDEKTDAGIDTLNTGEDICLECAERGETRLLKDLQ